MKKTLATAAVLAIIVSAVVFSPTIKTIAANVLAYFTGNTKTDYAREIHENVEQDAGTMELLSVSREGGDINMQVKFEFNEDVSELTDLCGEYKLPGMILSEDGTLSMEDGTVLEKNCTVNEDGVVVSEDGSTMYEMEDVYSNYNGPEAYVLYAPPFINSTILINGLDYMNMTDYERYMIPRRWKIFQSILFQSETQRYLVMP